MDLSIVIVSFNTRELLRECLQSLRSTVPAAVAHELIVVDSASVDESSDMVERMYPSVQLIRREKNEGFPAASNDGVRRASGRYILFLNPDTLVESEAVEG